MYRNICICIYICIYIYIYICSYVERYTHIYVHIYNSYTCVVSRHSTYISYIYTRAVFIYSLTWSISDRTGQHNVLRHLIICIYVCTCIIIYIHIYPHTYTHTHRHILDIYIYIHVHTHTVHKYNCIHVQYSYIATHAVFQRGEAKPTSRDTSSYCTYMHIYIYIYIYIHTYTQTVHKYHLYTRVVFIHSHTWRTYNASITSLSEPDDPLPSSSPRIL